MARRSVAQRAVGDLQRQIKRTLENSPLEPIGEMLIETLQGVVSAVEYGKTTVDQQSQTVTYVRQRFEALPNSFDKRFWIDSTNVAMIVDECSTGELDLSPVIMPRYEQEWGFQTVDLPHCGKQCQTVGVLLMPGSDDLSSVDLLDYPWLLHEFGHNIHFHSKRFSEQFSPYVEESIRRRKARIVADRGVARQLAMETIDTLETVWFPSPDHKNWAHEIAVDIVALWLCGPAYLAVFAQFLSDQKPRPFDLTKQHPPYDLRVSALIDAAERLGWSQYTADLESQIQRWNDDDGASQKTNQYRSLRDDDLVVSCVTCSLASCDTFGLPRLDEMKLNSLKKLVKNPKDCDFGVDLMTVAWLAEVELTHSEFDKWQDEVIGELHRSITQESH